jgi:two-component system response regulator NreC
MRMGRARAAPTIAGMQPRLTTRHTVHLPHRGVTRPRGREVDAALVAATQLRARLARMEEATRIVIADDHAVVRSGLRMLLDAEPDFDVVAEAGDVDSARRYVRGHHPQVLVLDLNMPGGSSLPYIPGLREEFPQTQIVVLTMQDDPAFAREAMRAGAIGYVLKEAADAELVEAVRMAASGQTYLQPQLGARLAAEPEHRVAGSELSGRELEVLRLIALGHTNARSRDSCT